MTKGLANQHHARIDSLSISLLCSLALLIFPVCSLAAKYTAGSAAEVAGLCGSVRPGDTIILASGTYTDEHFIFTGKGTKERPITLRAETPGKTILNGSSRLSIGGEYLVVDGLLFSGGALESGSVVDFQAEQGGAARHCTLRNSAVVDYNPADIDTRYTWVNLHGMSNIVEHCTFSGQKHSGVTVCVRLADVKTAGHIIRRNHFVDRPEGTGNGFECIRIGTGQYRMTDARCLVTENLFEKCDGEIEIISSKSCGNVYTSNTFLRSSGCLTLRQGNGCRVEDNVFIGGDAAGAGGLRITGKGHRIADNFFSGTKGRSGGAIALHAGVPGAPRGGYARVQDCVIEGNTFVDNPGPLFALDAGYGAKDRVLLPEGVIISDSLMLVPEGASPFIGAKNPPTGIAWTNNVVLGGDPGIELPPGIRSASAVPGRWKERTAPRPLEPVDVGPMWMRSEM